MRKVVTTIFVFVLTYHCSNSQKLAGNDVWNKLNFGFVSGHQNYDKVEKSYPANVVAEVGLKRETTFTKAEDKLSIIELSNLAISRKQIQLLLQALQQTMFKSAPPRVTPISDLTESDYDSYLQYIYK